MHSVFPLTGHYAYLADDGKCLPIPLKETFWTQEVQHLPPGRLISHFTFTEDWGNWEKHPGGDEWVLQFGGDDAHL